MLTYSTLKHSLSLSLKSILSLFHHIEYVFSSATLLIYLSLPTFTSVYLVYSFLCFHYFQSLSHLFSPSFFLHILCASVSSFSVPQLSTRQHSITSIKALSLSLPLAKSHSYTSFSLSLSRTQSCRHIYYNLFASTACTTQPHPDPHTLQHSHTYTLCVSSFCFLVNLEQKNVWLNNSCYTHRGPLHQGMGHLRKSWPNTK